MRKEIPKEWIYNFYGEAAKIEIWALEEHVVFIRALWNDVTNDEVRINGRFVYKIKHMPLKAGHAKRTHT